MESFLKKIFKPVGRMCKKRPSEYDGRLNNLCKQRKVEKHALLRESKVWLRYVKEKIWSPFPVYPLLSHHYHIHNTYDPDVWGRFSQVSVPYFDSILTLPTWR